MARRVQNSVPFLRRKRKPDAAVSLLGDVSLAQSESGDDGTSSISLPSSPFHLLTFPRERLQAFVVGRLQSYWALFNEGATTSRPVMVWGVMAMCSVRSPAAQGTGPVLVHSSTTS